MKLDYVEVNGLEYIEENNGAVKKPNRVEELIGRIDLCNKICKSIENCWNNYK
ncbi:hypothetical protein [uncultured Clostridium sp.]|uniref:hypothetical protein n=1 Tax=uncultured Clostridium sp. TaxID=59620 RepID=UPI0025CE5084|nr:hypothetical protein [uncultured Clostridium sp.]